MQRGCDVVLMAKLPVPGRVKTRLLARLSPLEAAGVHETCLIYLARRLSERNDVRLTVCFDPPDAEPSMRQLLPGLAGGFVPQCPGDLGQRLIAVSEIIFERSDRLIFLGCDSPDVPDELLDRAIAGLNASDMSIGPTEDGGFWCLGVRRGVDMQRLLAGVPWSSGRECESTLANAARLHLCVQVVGRWTDVDHPADVDALLWRLEHIRRPADIELFNEFRRRLPLLVPGTNATISEEKL
jgi:uncharacterized protein